ncbi:MAG: hypothetical protein JSS63_03830 [Bacteroidetes bacterium]|nr:hypothetical protein [Bacteroidota bacterium]
MINTIIENFFRDSDFEIIEILKKGDKSNKIIEIYIDREQSFSIDEIAEVNRGLNNAFDEHYTENDIAKISVSSPGADRPYKFFWQLEKHKGRTMEAALADGTTETGKLISCNSEDESFELEIRDAHKKSLTQTKIFSFKDISEIKAKLLFK